MLFKQRFFILKFLQEYCERNYQQISQKYNTEGILITKIGRLRRKLVGPRLANITIIGIGTNLHQIFDVFPKSGWK